MTIVKYINSDIYKYVCISLSLSRYVCVYPRPYRRRRRRRPLSVRPSVPSP